MSSFSLQGLIPLFLFFHLATFSCVTGRDRLCLECDYHLKKCVFCSNGYIESSRNICFPVSKTVKHCIRYADDSKCTLCSLGHYLDLSKNKCVKYKKVGSTIGPNRINQKKENSQHCLSGIGPSLCLICNKGLPNTKHKCNKKSVCSSPHCSICQYGLYYEEICFKCNIGYFNTQIGCVHSSKVKKKIKGCSRYKGTLDGCVRCKHNYHIGKSGECHKNVQSLGIGFSRIKTGLSFTSQWIWKLEGVLFFVFWMILS